MIISTNACQPAWFNPSNILVEMHKKSKLIRAGNPCLGWIDFCLKENKFITRCVRKLKKFIITTRIPNIFCQIKRWMVKCLGSDHRKINSIISNISLNFFLKFSLDTGKTMHWGTFWVFVHSNRKKNRNALEILNL